MKKNGATATVLPAFANLAGAGDAAGAVQVALVGHGWRGAPLLDALRGIRGARLVAVADIWPHALEAALGRARSLGWDVRGYASLAELLAAEGERVDAVVVATPDWQHANHIAACLAAGKHVYCEGELADSVAKARELVRTARTADRLVQGGHRRRSNPRYLNAIACLHHEHHLLGRVTNAYAQWHRPARDLRAVPARLALPTEVLEANGYADMEAFLNWQWHRKYGWGAAAAMAGEKLDVMRWVAGGEPTEIAAVGGNDYCGRETEDNLMALVTFAGDGKVPMHGHVQITNNLGCGGSYERFIGELGVLKISEMAGQGNSFQPCKLSETLSVSTMDATVWLKELKSHVAAGRLMRRPPLTEEQRYFLWIFDTEMFPQPLPLGEGRPVAVPHLENFIQAIRGEAAQAEPAEAAFRNLVGVEAVVRAMRSRERVRLAEQDFEV